MTEMTIHTERVDDIPLLFGFLQQMGIQKTLDNIVEPHGNRGGLSVGWLITACPHTKGSGCKGLHR